jgi:hypothetical protein
MAIPPYNPGTLNTWLTQHNGFESGDGFVWGATNPLGLVFENLTTDHNAMRVAFNAGKIVILHVHNGHHYVLTTGVDGDTFNVNDPLYDTASYTETQVVDAAIFHQTKGSVAQIADTALEILEDDSNMDENEIDESSGFDFSQ